MAERLRPDLSDSTPLTDAKCIRCLEIDEKTRALISDGFTYDSKTFSLSLEAKSNWDRIHGSPDHYTYPLDISTMDDDIYELAEANVDAFWEASQLELDSHLDSGRTLKKSIYDSIDRASVDAVVDTR